VYTNKGFNRFLKELKMKNLWWLMLMGLWMGGIDAGMPQLPESPVDHEAVMRETWKEAWNQCRRMRSMGVQFQVDNHGNVCGGVDEDVRIRHVANYYYDLQIRIDQLEKMRKARPDFFRVRNLDTLKGIVYPYKYYPTNVYFPNTPLPEEDEDEQEDEGANNPLLPGDDDVPSFSDGDEDDSDRDDERDSDEGDVAMHIDQGEDSAADQGNNDPFDWD
jgi:hypothetical protein